MAAPTGDERARAVARAWTLHSLNRKTTLREIADALADEGWAVSHETVRVYLAEAQEAQQWGDLQDLARKRGRVVTLLEELTRRGIGALEGRPAGTLGPDDEGMEPRPYAEVVPPLMKVVQELNRVEGNYAPTRVAVTDDRRPPDPKLIAAMEAEARRAEALDADEQRRELEA